MNLKRLRRAMLPLTLTIIAATALSGPAAATEPVSNWVQVSSRNYSGFSGIEKSQGIASDGRRVFFSWNVGLHSTGLDLGDKITDNSLDAIPADLKAKSLNHIGDIDYHDGKIYAPIEDGPKYLHPYIVPYDADTLKPTSDRFLLDRGKLMEGVPWVAIDAARQVAYTAEWNNTNVLNVHRLSDFAITSTVALDKTVGRIQGAKVYKGFLYASRDNGAEKSIEAIDPTTGHVTHLFDRNLGTDHEAEGIAFVTNDSGTTMLASEIDKNPGGGVNVHSYRIAGDTTPPSLKATRPKPRKIRRGGSFRVALTASEDVTVAATWSRCAGPKRKPCRRLKSAGRAPALNLIAGRSPVRFAAKRGIGRSAKPLAAGTYRLTLTPTDQADAKGRPAVVGFTVVKPKRRR